MTAIIVNDKGEVFTHWALACTVTAWGSEEYHSVPQFGRTETVVVRDNDFRPFWLTDKHRRHYTINKPYVFSSVDTAKKALARMWPRHRLAVVS